MVWALHSETMDSRSIQRGGGVIEGDREESQGSASGSGSEQRPSKKNKVSVSFNEKRNWERPR